MCNNKVIILTEAGRKIGFGHLTRCIGLYQGFKEKNIDAQIIVNGDSSVDYLLKNIKHKKLNWLKNHQTTLKKLKNTDIVVIDSYLAPLDFYKKVSNIVKIPVYIDDYKRLNYPQGIVINPSIYGDKINYPTKNGVRYLLGKDYIILRKEFWQVPLKKINKDIKNVLITFGGMNHIKLANRIANYLKSKFNFTVSIIDPAENFTARQMLNLMLKQDLCISGGGQTTYELARVGAPTIGICFAKNQLNNLIWWQKKGFLEYGGYFDDKNLLGRLLCNIDRLSSYKERKIRNKIGKTLVNGKGVKNIINKIIYKI